MFICRFAFQEHKFTLKVCYLHSKQPYTNSIDSVGVCMYGDVKNCMNSSLTYKFGKTNRTPID